MVKSYLKTNLKLLLSLLCLLISFLVIIGWFFNSEIILQYLADRAGMKFNTALFFLIISLILILDQHLLSYSTLKKALLFFVFLLSAYTILIYTVELPISIDNLVIKDNYNSIYPGRMSVGTAVCFMLLSSGLLLLKSKKQKVIICAQHLFALIISIAIISFITHILNIPNENKSMFLDTMSAVTSILFLILGAVSSLKNKSVGIFSIFFTNLAGSNILKSIFPIIFLIPICLSYLLIFAISESIVKSDFGIVLHTVLLVIITFICIAYISSNLNKTDLKRKKLENLLQQSNKELLRLNNQLTEKNKDLEQFVYIASHDLQEPLRTVTSISELLKDEYKDSMDENAKTYINFITEGIARMHCLVRDLMDYSRLGNEVKFSEVNVNAVLEDIKKDLSLKLKESKTEIKHNTLPNIIANESGIRQLFQNLISNAIKFRKKETVPNIIITTNDKGDFWQFNIQDNGIGIEKKHSEKIFKIFKRLHRETEYTGTGIGLANCKKIVELHNGKIWLTSILNEGSTFHFTLKK
ncbi:ATP-binding protein [Polaribacter sp. Asnod6-C07]|uniref:sensor histidine kinase n=1 Tax=Polaribacter sp. Asnod6-C07 TaxID=3160582 RepID=UPI00386322DF